MTSTSLFNCFVICSIIRSSPLVTPVICAVDGSTDGPTEILSILKPLPLKSPATRDSTPNLFSTSILIMCCETDIRYPLCQKYRILLNLPALCIFSRFFFFLRREYHITITATCRDHRKYILFRFDDKVHYYRSFNTNRLFNYSLHFRCSHSPQANRPVSLSKFDIVRRIAKDTARVMPVKKKLLPLPYHAERTIVQYSHFNWKIVCHCSSYFLRVHLKASVTGKIKYQLVRIGRLRTQCSRQTKAHCPEST